VKQNVYRNFDFRRARRRAEVAKGGITRQSHTLGVMPREGGASSLMATAQFPDKGRSSPGCVLQ
jgi:hypothetical protein